MQKDRSQDGGGAAVPELATRAQMLLSAMTFGAPVEELERMREQCLENAEADDCDASRRRRLERVADELALRIARVRGGGAPPMQVRYREDFEDAALLGGCQECRPSKPCTAHFHCTVSCGAHPRAGTSAVYSVEQHALGLRCLECSAWVVVVSVAGAPEPAVRHVARTREDRDQEMLED